MFSKEEQLRAVIAEQASEWFAANDEGPLSARDSAALVAWLAASPLHVEEFLRVAAIARDLHEAGADPEHSIEALIARARADDGAPIRPLWPRLLAAVSPLTDKRWQRAAVTLAACGALAFGFYWLWTLRPIAHMPAASEVTALHFQTRHGEQQSLRLPDNSMLRLNTDTAVDVRYSKEERLVRLSSGEAEFEVVHEADRPFRVFAGPAEVVDAGTQFDVRLEDHATLITVLEGRVMVGRSTTAQTGRSGANPAIAPAFVELRGNQQLRVTPGQWPAVPVTVDAQQANRWLHHEISFENEPLGRVASEFNRYAPKRIEIMTPELRDLQISGVFSTDDPEAFLAFLRSLDGVRVQVTANRILVSRK
jgi:transmembrane sensor